MVKINQINLRCVPSLGLLVCSFVFLVIVNGISAEKELDTRPISANALEFCKENEERKNFCQHLKHFKKYYRTGEELERRFYIFQENALAVEELNALQENRASRGMAEYSVTFSPFGDWSTEEFETKVLMRNLKPAPLKYSEPTPHFETRRKLHSLPKRFDWTEHDAVTPVKDQGSIGTCWAFSAIGVIEGQIAIKYGRKVDLSVEQLIECDSLSNHTSGDADCAEFGGWPYLAYSFLRDYGGIYADSDWPYCSGTLNPKTLIPDCFPCMPNSYDKQSCGDHSDLYCNISSTKGQGSRGWCQKKPSMPVAAKVKDWEILSSNETELAARLASSGPISVAMNAKSLQFYRKGIIDPFFCDKSSLNHAVLLVGFDEESNIPYWKVKNSWGGQFGEKGYFRVRRGKGTCGINTAATFARIV